MRLPQELSYGIGDEAGHALPSLSQPDRITAIVHLLNRKVFPPHDLPVEVQRDLALSIRSRGDPEELALLDPDKTFFTFDSYGTYTVPGKDSVFLAPGRRVTELPSSRVIVSVPTWKAARQELETFDFGSSVVLLPEIITIAGELEVRDLRDKEKVKDASDSNLEALKSISRQHPKASFIVGTLQFADTHEMPYNAAFHIQNGVAIGMTQKHEGTPQERSHFTFDRRRQPLTVQNGAVMICRDLMTYATYAHPLRPEAPELSQFVTDETDELLTIACWGVGSSKLKPDETNTATINDYYEGRLREIIDSIFERNATIQKIVMADRLAAFSPQSPVSTRLFSAVAFRPNKNVPTNATAVR